MSSKRTDFGILCATYRVQKAMTEDALGKRMGKRQSDVSLIEHGRATVTLEYIKGVMDAFELNQKEKVDFLSKSLLCLPQIPIPLNDSSIISKEALAGILASIVLNDSEAIQKSVNLVQKQLSRLRIEKQGFVNLGTGDADAI